MQLVYDNQGSRVECPIKGKRQVTKDHRIYLVTLPSGHDFAAVAFGDKPTSVVMFHKSYFEPSEYGDSFVRKVTKTATAGGMRFKLISAP